MSTAIAHELITVLQAADVAARWHVNQRRKGAAAEPYINHLIEVAMLVAKATSATDPNLITAALSHDAIEDQQVPREEIARQFTEDVAMLVEEVTDTKSLPKHVRKQIQIDKAGDKSPRAKILKLADMTSNLRALGTSPPSHWSVQRRLEYVRCSRAVFDGLKCSSPWLEEMFSQAAQQAEQV